ncbi:ESCRT-I complex subunit MVB12 [Paragonimus westermani]|uniref:ESCRT-I complex subunit MVB12 n=1 Tax=Paragonimus westermani TaxID=34504 RepID=A0A5J4NJD7_9TREM|nr:ESCRT-I complex subunit MVB12 [Paragonimus westermani]
MSRPDSTTAGSVITSVGVVSSLTYVPLHFIVISNTSFGSEDADLWRDRLLSRKSRYLAYRKENVTDCVCIISTHLVTFYLEYTFDWHPKLEHLKVLSERCGSFVPFTIFSFFQCERATKKKLICAKYVPLGSTSTAINEIMINSRGQRLISGFTAVGELNSLSILYKLSTLPGTAVWSPSSAQRGSPSRSTHSSRTHSPVSHSGPTNSTHNASKEMYAFATKRRGTVHPLHEIPFELNKNISFEDSATADVHHFVASCMGQFGSLREIRLPTDSAIL